MSIPGTVENEVLFGFDNTLFLAGGAHSVLDLVNRQKSVSYLSLDVFRRNIRDRAVWAKARGMAYAHIIFPDKQSIAPELWPFDDPLKMGQVCLDGTEDDLPVFYPVALLTEHRAETVSRVDTHITDYGSILVAGKIIERATGQQMGEATADLLKTLSGIKTFEGDLGSKIIPARTATQKVSVAAVPGRSLTSDIGGGNNGLVDLRFCYTPMFDKRLVMFGDSFGRSICRFLQFWFREVIFLRSGFFHEEMAELLVPDVLITENVERYLNNSQPDEARPHFLMYPFLKETRAGPSPEFARAFSAMLSYPRSPYVNFKSSQEFHRKMDASLNKKGPYTSSSITLAKKTDSSSDVLMIEPVKIVRRVMPEFVCDMSQRDQKPFLPPDQDLHGSYLAERNDILLFGPSVQVQRDGRWSTESRSFAEQFIESARSAGFTASFPGPKPRISLLDGSYTVSFSSIRDSIRELDQPVFLATPLEPLNWGRWLHTVVPKVHNFRLYGEDRKILVNVSKKWQRDLLAFLGVSEQDIIAHDPGGTYFCRNIRSVEYNVTNMTISHQERRIFEDLRRRVAISRGSRAPNRKFGKKLFISRLSTSKKHPHYRMLVNEEALADRLGELGYQTIEPEALSIADQIDAYANATAIVSLGGAAVYNAMFCSPATSFITVESSGMFLQAHCGMLSSLGLRYGVIIGEQDPLDVAPAHKRWKVDVNVVAKHAVKFEL